MNKIFMKLPFPIKLTLIGLTPLAFLVYFAIEITQEKKDRVIVINRVIENINRSLSVMELASQLQMERRMSFAYSLDKVSSPELIAQYAQTDAAIKSVEKLMADTGGNFKDYSLINQLFIKRKQVIKRLLSSNEVLNFYSNSLIRVSSLSTNNMDNLPFLKSVSDDLKGQETIFQLINYFGILRSSIYSAALTKTSDKYIFEDIGKNYELTTSYWAEFESKASSSAIEDFQKVNQKPEAIFVNNALTEIIKIKAIPPNFNYELWWENSAKLVDDIKQAQTNLSKRAKFTAEELQRKEKDDLNRHIFFLSLVILSVVLIVFFTITSISSLLVKIRIAAEKISQGNSNINLDIHTNDAIGSLAKSICTVALSNKKLSEATASIGSGNFDIAIKPRSNEDQLGLSILKMRDDLKLFAKENHETIWIQTGLSKINDSIKGGQLLSELCTSAINTFTNYLDANVGLIYVSDNDNFRLCAGYALPSEYSLNQLIEPGESLVGQSASEGKIIIIEDLPENHVKITSGMGESSPKQLAIIPLIHNEIVEGVIEIGSIKPFSPIARILMKQGAANIATAIQAAKSRAKLQELLEETQAQTEELQAQHSELENLNTELEAQAQKLQASEEELKVQQEELLQANKELEERSRSLEEKNQVIVDRNLDIQKKAEELEQSTKYKSEFLANMSHELRTPLNSILLLSRLMFENAEKNLTEDQIEYARVIQSSGNGLLSLIDEILDLSKIEAGKMELEFAETSVKSVILDLKSLFDPIAKQKHLELNIQMAPDLMETITTDRLRLDQILKNLVSNALKFTSKGSVKISVGHPENNKSFICFSVKDTGIGIEKEKQALVFEAFQQADGSTRRRFGGTGLGLSISRELSKLLKGEIILTSEPGKGSEFTLIIPVNPEINQTPPNPPQSILSDTEIDVESLTKLEPETIEKAYVVENIPPSIPDDRDNITEHDRPVLIIEDDTNFAKTLLQFTKKSGYKGIVAVRGDLGIQMAIKYKPTAILLDIQLPVKDGWEVMEELKSNPLTRHIPVHIMSSLEAKRESLIKGAVDFINKPVALEQMKQIFSKLEDALNRHPKKVMIIEENTKHAEALSSYLSSFDITSEIRTSVNEGVTAIQQSGIDCVILDMGIPNQSAYQTLEALKTTEGLENLPIIIFTGKNLSTSEEGRLKKYADSIVMKTAHSYQRILDEVALFLHLIEEKRSVDADKGRKNLMDLNEVLKDKTVLIADDDVRNIFSLTKSLEQVKMKVLSATDGKEALRILEENPDVDVVLMDMMMPEMDGYESTALIRKNIKYRNLPILAVTAKAMVGDREKCIKAGASDYISKPVDIDQLISLLRVWLYDKQY